jgi:hypothetical protein
MHQAHLPKSPQKIGSMINHKVFKEEVNDLVSRRFGQVKDYKQVKNLRI